MVLVAIYATDPTPSAGKPIFNIRPIWDISYDFLKEKKVIKEMNLNYNHLIIVKRVLVEISE